MADVININYATAQTIYVHIHNTTGYWWNGTTFETYSAANWSTYSIALTESGSSTYYSVAFPTDISAGRYYLSFFNQAGASPDVTDTPIATNYVDWNGSAITGGFGSAGGMSGSDWLAYVLRRGPKRTDKSTEIYEGTTDAVQEMLRRFQWDEAEKETTTTDTISTLGDFKLSVESDFGILTGIVMEDDENAHRLIHVSKVEFDSIYPDINVTNDRGYPKHFCIFSGTIYLGPIPDSTDYSYRKTYTQIGTTINASTTSVPFTDKYRDVLVNLVLSKFYRDMENYEKAQFFEVQFEKELMFAERKERINKGGGYFNVKPAIC